MDREKLVYDSGKYTIRAFSRDIYEGKVSLKQDDEEQSYLANKSDKFIKETKPKNVDKKQQRKVVWKNLHDFLNAREMVLNGFKSKIVLSKSIGTGILNSYNSNFKILTPKQMLQLLPIVLAQVQTGNKSKNLLNEIRQIVYSLY